ncbi:exonuclease domain-containing protein [Antribacter gilvus]|uniref:exonuclease domain-containing protein n=1 Tax=Antribacter gilvus TaxID=2304675 RepID=UPI000F7A5DDD|nr:exonuclease domain-containing protein [Antribacter gilvus]
MAGYAVVDVETTGLFPGGQDRIAEIAVVQVSADGEVEASWSTLVNPGRDLGPQGIHGISAADVRHAPAFGEVAGQVAELVAGRAFVAHNAQFDRRFVWHAFAAEGYDVPVIEQTTLCTMRTGALLAPNAPRSLAGACAYHEVDLRSAHEALSDAMAAAELLRKFLAAGPRTLQPEWDDVVELAATTPWPHVPRKGTMAVGRGVSTERDTHFFARLVAARNRPITSWEKEEYLALVDRALLDRHLSAREHDQLRAFCAQIDLGRNDADLLHREYLAALAANAWADGVLTDAERADLHAVANLLQVSADDVDRVLADSATCPEVRSVPASRAAFRTGDLVVFTGAMREQRDVWERRARAVGLVPHPNVTKKVALVIAADPDSLSGKARKAADYGIPIVSEEGFERLLAQSMV